MIQDHGMLRSLLEAAAAKFLPVSICASLEPSVDYVTGHADGRLYGEVLGLALALSLLTGGSPTEIVESALLQVQINSGIPFELVVV